MHRRVIKDRIHWLGSIDWDRRLFDSLIPLPDGTTYNAYLVEGSTHTALLDTVDPPKLDELMAQVADIDRIDYIVAHHAEQDHSGSIPQVLERFPQAKVIASSRAKGMLTDLLPIPEEAFIVVEDGDTISLGDKTLRFIYTPWVHWPETMVTYLEEDQILFSCDFFGSHTAGSDLYAVDRNRIQVAAKRYYAEIMMPFRNIIKKNLEKLEPFDIRMIAPSHGPIYHEPDWILETYREWAQGVPHNSVVLPYVSMHNSTQLLVDRLISALCKRGVHVAPFNLPVTDIGELAMSLVDAGSIVVGAPTVLGGPHPLAAYATILANALKPKAQFLSIVGSYGWGGRMVEALAGMIPSLKVEILDPVICKGLPSRDDYEAIDCLAETIARKHKENGFL